MAGCSCNHNDTEIPNGLVASFTGRMVTRGTHEFVCDFPVTYELVDGNKVVTLTLSRLYDYTFEPTYTTELTSLSTPFCASIDYCAYCNDLLVDTLKSCFDSGVATPSGTATYSVDDFGGCGINYSNGTPEAIDFAYYFGSACDYDCNQSLDCIEIGLVGWCLGPDHIVFNVTFVDTPYPCSGGEGQSFYSKMARFSDWGFDIPENSEIIGIQAKIFKHSENLSNVTDSIVKLMKNHRIIGKNKAYDDIKWQYKSNVSTYGSIVDMWGIDKIEVNDINNSGFGIAIEAEDLSIGERSKAYIDSIQLSVFYKINNDIFSDEKSQYWDGAVYPIFG